jgi:hypothetical protein
MTERGRDRWIYPAAWLALAAIYTAALTASGLAAGLAIRNVAANLLPDALLGIAVLRLPAMVRWPEGSKGRFFALHAGALALFAIASAAGWIALMLLDSIVFGGRIKVDLSIRFIPFRLVYDILIYCTLAGFAYARDHAARAARAEALRARAALEAMRSQLNPHFILNTFHALLGLIRRDPALAERALERLGDLLRYSLRVQRDGIDEVPLRDECAFVDSYLELERLRLAERLRVTVDAPQAAMETLVPTFALQILVENAIRHAIAPRAAGGMLEIRVAQNDGRLHLAVRDEGAGEATVHGENGSGVGLRLLHERLGALYGSDARLTMRKTDGGTCADLELPARRIAAEER